MITIIFERKNVTSKTPPGRHVFLPIQTIFELNLLTCFHYTHIEKTAPPPGGHFHDDWAKIVTSRVFTRNTALPPGGHLHEDWGSIVTSTVFTSFELSRGIVRTNILTKFHKDHTRNVASRVFTRQNIDDGHTTDAGRTKGNPKSSPGAHCAQVS
ncbi:hypothetical protein DPMN_088574 [Dreissena polymorpha]|uniref:Uncharacterized protein n=1 Tax=Dreissena polymorpha TaxID=45954 RepID=A0A9D4KUC1_DREPO|nr:hypothetical protein DPMN_088574 [Dreissena polymorpha]